VAAQRRRPGLLGTAERQRLAAEEPAVQRRAADALRLVRREVVEGEAPAVRLDQAALQAVVGVEAVGRETAADARLDHGPWPDVDPRPEEREPDRQPSVLLGQGVQPALGVELQGQPGQQPGQQARPRHRQADLVFGLGRHGSGEVQLLEDRRRRQQGLGAEVAQAEAQVETPPGLGEDALGVVGAGLGEGGGLQEGLRQLQGGDPGQAAAGDHASVRLQQRPHSLQDRHAALGAAQRADDLRDHQVDRLRQGQGPCVAADQGDALAQPQALDGGAGLFVGGLQQLDGIDVARAGLQAEPGLDRLAAGADVEHHLVPHGAAIGGAVGLVAPLVGGQRVVEQLVVDEELGDRGPELQRLLRRPRRVVGDQPRLAGALGAQAHRRLGHGRVAAQHRLDLLRLDAVAAQLHLAVDPAEVLQRAVAPPPHAVAAAEEAGARRAGEGVGDEALGRLGRAAEVAAREAAAADVELAGLARRRRFAVAVEDVGVLARQRPADRRRAFRLRVDHRLGGADRHLGGAVGVEEAAAGRPAPRHLGRAGLAGRGQGGERRQALRRHDGQRARRQGDDGDAPRAQAGQQVGPGQQRAARRQAEAGAGQQRGEDLRDRGVEGQGGKLQHPALGTDGEVGDLRPGQLHRAALLHRHPLGLPGRARGVDQVAQRLRTGERGQGGGGTLVVQAQQPCAGRQEGQCFGAGLSSVIASEAKQSRAVALLPLDRHAPFGRSR